MGTEGRGCACCCCNPSQPVLMANPTQLGFFEEPLPEPPELNKLNHVQPPGDAPNLEGKDLGMARALSATSETMKAAALAIAKEVLINNELLTTDDVHLAWYEAGVLIRPKAVGPIWQKIRRNQWVVASGLPDQPTRRPRANGRTVPVLRSRLYQTDHH